MGWGFCTVFRGRVMEVVGGGRRGWAGLEVDLRREREEVQEEVQEGEEEQRQCQKSNGTICCTISEWYRTNMRGREDKLRWEARW